MNIPPNLKITIEDVKAEILRRKYNKIDSYFPDKGPLKRELYTKHMEFFEAGATERERTAMAANRCITPWCYFPNNQQALSVVSCSSFGVQAWDGETQCNAVASGGFLKGILPAFRVVLDNNQFFDCTGEHLLLTSEGYLSLSQLMLRANGLRLTRKREDYQANCVLDGYLCGQQPHYQEGISQGLFLPLGGVLEPYPSEITDAAGNRYQCNHVFQEHVPFSSKDDLNRLLALFEMFSIASYKSPFVQLSDDIQDFLQSVPALCQNPEGLISFYNQDALRGRLCYELSLGLSGLDILFPYFHAPLLGGKSIKCVVPLGLQPIIDFTVPQYKNYMMAGVYHHNTGKTEGMGGYEAVCHATGNYPPWWVGRRFKKPINILIGGETGKLVRDSIQQKLLGPLHDMGTGLIRKQDILNTTPKQGITLAVDQIFVRHPKGQSVIQFQSYDQGREVFQATERDIVWFDEEPPLDIYAEGLIRTATTDGMIMSTFTPLKGMSETVLSLREKEAQGIGKIITATWDDVPHLSEKQKTELWNSLPPHQRDARTKGVPALGSGAIYPVSEEFIVIDDMVIPEHWKRAYGMDVGWNNTAALWGAYDPDTDTLYITNEYKRGQAEPPSHAAAIKAPGDWIPGCIDPASVGSNQRDGANLAQEYRQLGLKLTFADNSVEAGLFDVYSRMVSGRLKIFKSCSKTLTEYRLYRRDEKGKIVKEMDHLMDCLRYLVRTGISIAANKTVAEFIAPGYYSSKMRGVY